MIKKSSFSVYLEPMFIVKQAKWISEPALLMELSILCKAMGLVRRRQRMLCCDTNLSLIKTAVAPESSMARVRTLLFIPLTSTEKWRCEENGSTVHTVHEEIESNIVRGPLSDGVSEISGLDDTALS
jgi:hypothetical protein